MENSSCREATSKEVNDAFRCVGRQFLKLAKAFFVMSGESVNLFLIQNQRSHPRKEDRASINFLKMY